MSVRIIRRDVVTRGLLSRHPFARGLFGGGLLVALAAAGCARKAEPGSVSPQHMADALYAVMSSDREVYAREVVDRLEYQERLMKAGEHYKEDKGLPLPAQMFRMGSELAHKKNSTFAYALLSPWPINKQNGPRTELEQAGLRSVTETGKNYYTEETVGGKRYFTAYYPDKAVVDACVTCHNAHPDSPRKDFKVGDVLGGVVIRVPLEP
jgi:hypothetical protein